MRYHSTRLNGNFKLHIDFATLAACVHNESSYVGAPRYVIRVTSNRYKSASTLFHGRYGSECRYFNKAQIEYVEQIFELDPGLLFRDGGGCITITLDATNRGD